jgi:hypothetical protein
VSAETEADTSLPQTASPAATGPSIPAVAEATPAATSAAKVMPPVVEVRDLDFEAIRQQVDPQAVRARMPTVVARMETLLDDVAGPGLLFDRDRSYEGDRAIQVPEVDAGGPLWIIGDLHGDLLALEAALAQIRACCAPGSSEPPRIIFLGDFVDDEGLALELLVRVFELIVQSPQHVCVIAGNHDEALSLDGQHFASSVSPSDFADFLNAHLGDEWIQRVGKLAVRLTAHAPRALFFPDGLLVAHAGFPLLDLHPALSETRNWNDPACLSDFAWVRAHPKARRKLPNRFSRGSQFGYEDFADFCALSAKLGRPVTHMVRGHDHPDDRYAIYPAYQAHPLITTVALSRRLPRERFGPYERAPTLVRVLPGSLPQVYQLHLPAALINEVFPQPSASSAPEVDMNGAVSA